MTGIESVFGSKVAGSLGSALAQGILKRARKSLAEKLAPPEREEALARCAQAGVVALVEEGRPEEVGQDLREHLLEVLGRFTEDAEVQRILADAIKAESLDEDDLEELEARFREEHAPGETLPGFDVGRGIGALVVGFVEQADGEPAFRDVIQTSALRAQVRELMEQTGLLEVLVDVETRQVEVGERQLGVQEEIRDRLGEGREARVGRARVRYLERLRRDCLRLPASRLLMEQGLTGAVTLDRVYVELDTKTPKEEASDRSAGGAKDRGKGALELERDPKRLSALEVFEEDNRLVILGDPGSGKSTFTRSVLARLAGAQLEEGVEPPPGLAEDAVPVFVVLRRLSGRLEGVELDELAGEERVDALARAVQEEVLADLSEEQGTADYRSELGRALSEGSCVLVFDGLDEVPESRREVVREAVLATAERFDPERVVVTCRVRSYGGPFTLPGFSAHELAPFDEEKIEQFCTAWYQALGVLGGVGPGRVDVEGADLRSAALAPSLARLAENPLLLTTMAVLHTRRAELPRERGKVYQESIELLVRDWQRERVGKKLVESDELREFLQDDKRLWPLLRRLAYEAHREGGTEREVAAGLSEGDLLVLLKDPEFLGSADLAEEFLDYADQRAGPLIGQGGRPGEPAAFSFVHRTFQEYLAGRYLTTSVWHPLDELYQHAAEGDLWSLAVELGAEALLYVDTRTKELLELAFGLGAAEPGESDQARRAVLWAGKMAALIGREVVERERHGPVAGKDFLEALRPKLVELLGTELPEAERVEAGDALGQLGDPRLADPEENWVEIPGGTFWMGAQKEDPEAPGYDPEAFDDEAPVRRVTVKPFVLGRYPVTVQEFRRFVEAGEEGYLNPKYWEPDGWAWREKENSVGPEWWDEQLRHPNRPVTGVSWYEADAYCRWVGGRLLTEAEWEYAAREEEGSKYPWGGEEPDDRRANFDLRVGHPSPVGAYPLGSSPEGVHDLAGNVWEWCADWKGTYAEEDEEDPTGPESGTSRVLRGGSFNDGPGALRAAYRYVIPPGYWDVRLGFRVLRSSSRGLA